MNKEDIKKYILKTWSVSSGKRITAMLKKYWELKEEKINSAPDIVETAKEIFNIKL